VAATYSATGPGTGGAFATGATSLSFSHPGGASDTAVYMAVAVGNNADAGVTCSATFNAVAMTATPAKVETGSGGAGFLQGFKVESPPGGTQTVAVSVSATSDLTAGTISVTGSGGTGTPWSAANTGGSSTPATATSPGAIPATSLVVAFVAAGQPVSSTTSPSTSRYVDSLNSGSGAGNSAGATSPGTGSAVTTAWALSGADFWAVVAFEAQAPIAAPAAAQPARPGKAWLRRFRHRQVLQAPPAPPPAGVAAPAGAGALSAVATVAAPASLAGAGAVSASVIPCITGLGGTGAGYFADTGGTPRMVLGDAAWGLPGNAGRWNSGNWQADFDGYLANRAGQGFNVVYAKPMGTTQNGGINDDGRTFDGLFPFLGGSLANPSTGLTSSYWARIDYFLASALAKGVTVFLNAIGYDSDFETSGPLAGKSATEFQAYGAAIGARYAGQGNLIWMVADDYFGSSDAKISSFLTGLRGAGASQPISIENMPESTSRTALKRVDAGCGTTNGSATVTDSSCSANDAGAGVSGSGIPAGTVINSVTPGVSFVMSNAATATATVSLTITDYHLPWGQSNAQFNFVYSYNAAYFAVEKAYLESSPVPVIWGDGYFYQGGNSGSYQGGTGAFAYDHAVRQDAWHAVSSGARGWVNGSEGIWQYQSTALADSALEWWYVHNAGAIRAFVESLPGWHTLVPDTSSALVTGGRGTHASSLSSGGGGGQYEVAFTDSYVTASRGPDGGSGASLALIYMSHGSTITIDQTKMASGYTATWVDPVTLATSAATPGSTYNSTAKGSNSAGEADWALVLQAPSAVSGTASLAGTGGVAALAVQASAATAAGAGALAAVSAQRASASPSGTGAVSSPATQAATAALAGAGTVTAVPGGTASGVASLAGAGSVSALATQAVPASLAGAGALAALAGQRATASPAAAGTLAALAVQAAPVTAAAAGTLTANSGSSASGTVALAAAGTLSAPAVTVAPAALSGAGAVAAKAVQAVTAAPGGAGALAVTAAQRAAATAAGAGTVAAAAVTAGPFTVGILTASTQAGLNAASTYAPSGASATSSGINTSATSP
jgi:hypothetical protein